MRLLRQEVHEREHPEAAHSQQPQSKATAVPVLRQSIRQKRPPRQTHPGGPRQREEVRLSALRQELHQPRGFAPARWKGSPRKELRMQQVRPEIRHQHTASDTRAGDEPGVEPALLRDLRREVPHRVLDARALEQVAQAQGLEVRSLRWKLQGQIHPTSSLEEDASNGLGHHQIQFTNVIFLPNV